RRHSCLPCRDSSRHPFAVVTSVEGGGRHGGPRGRGGGPGPGAPGLVRPDRDHRIVVMIPKTCLLLGCAALAFGAQPQKVFPYEYSREDLPNGLRLIVVPTDYANIVANYIVVQTGSRNEVEPGHTGFAHLFEHLMFRGTEKYPPDKYNQTLSRMGAASNASTSDDLTVYHTTFS